MGSVNSRHTPAEGPSNRVTRHTHYAATIQPLSVMMMAALNRGTAFKPPPMQALSCGEGVKAGGFLNLPAAEFRHAISSRFECHGPPGFFSPPPSCSGDHLIGSRTSETLRLRYLGVEGFQLRSRSMWSSNASWQKRFRARLEIPTSITDSLSYEQESCSRKYVDLAVHTSPLLSKNGYLS